MSLKTEAPKTLNFNFYKLEYRNILFIAIYFIDYEKNNRKGIYMKIKYCVPILLIIFIFSFTGCNNLKTAKGVDALTKNETTVEVTTTTKGVTATTVAETTTTKNNDINDMLLFRGLIQDYDPISSGKAVDYALEALKILQEENTRQGLGDRYEKLANKVGSDYSDLSFQKEKILDKSGIQNITPEMKQMISLLIDWSHKMETIYDYTAKYYYGEGGEFKIKADELQDEVDKILDEYMKLYNKK